MYKNIFVNRSQKLLSTQGLTVNTVCFFQTSDMRYDCSSNLTIHNLTKEDNKRLVSCSIEYEGMNYTTGGMSIEAYCK